MQATISIESGISNVYIYARIGSNSLPIGIGPTVFAAYIDARVTVENLLQNLQAMSTGFTEGAE